MAHKKTDILYDSDGEEITNIVLDNGSSMCRAGFAGQDAPKVKFPAMVAKPRNESHIVGLNKKELYVGSEAQDLRELLSLKYPVERGIVTDWDAMEAIWEHAFGKLGVRSDDYKVLLSEAVRNPEGNREMSAQVMFEHFNTPSFYLAKSALLTCYACGRGSCIVCESGGGTTQIVPIYESYLMNEGVRRVDMSGTDLTHFLASQLQKRGYSFTSSAEMELVRDMKEKLCSVAQDYESEVRERQEDVSYTLPDGNQVTLGSERLTCPEAMFQPKLMGLEKFRGLHQEVYNSLMGCDIDTRADLYVNIILGGGNTFFPGFGDRLESELRRLIPSTMRMRVVRPPERKYSTFIGGSILASLSTFEHMWITKEDYLEVGPNIVQRK